MAQMTRPRLQRIEPLPDFTMQLTFINDATVVIDFKPFFAESPGLAPLRDPEIFSQAAIIPGEGWTVVWSACDIQIGADTLWLDALTQLAPNEEARAFAGWRSRYGLSLKQAAEALGVTPRTISAYSNGSRPIPKPYNWPALGGKHLEMRRKIRSPFFIVSAVPFLFRSIFST